MSRQGGIVLDLPGFAAFLCLGFFPGDRTWVEGLPYNQAAPRRWAWPQRIDGPTSLNEAVPLVREVLGAKLLDAVSTGRVAVPVSGGLDSRTTVALIPAEAWNSGRLWAYSYGYAEASAELRIAQTIAQRRALPFGRFVVGEYLFDHLDELDAVLDGFVDLTQPRQAAISAVLAERADAVLCAHWGDVWFDASGLPPDAGDTPEKLAALAWSKWAKGGREHLLGLFAPVWKGEDPERLVVDLLTAEAARLDPIEDADLRFKAFKTEQWSRRWTLASLNAFRLAGVETRLPFYDPTVALTLANMPSALLRGRKLQVELIKATAPDLARIVWQAWDADLYWYPYFDSLLVPKRAWRWLERKLQPRVPIRNWEVQLLSARGRAGLRDRLLAPGRRIHDWVEPQAIKSFLDRFFAGPDAGAGYAASMLLTVAVALDRLDLQR